MKKPKLQVALDLTSLEQALRIAQAAVSAGAEIVEVGTPLIKAEGMKSVRVLKEEFSDKEVVADMKTMDAGAIEAEMAFTAGADIVTVMALASDETILSVLDVAKQYGGQVLVDLMNVKNLNERLHQLVDLGCGFFCFHVGVDVQKKRGVTIVDLADEVSQAKSIFNIKVAVAGGLNSETVPVFVRKGVDVLIVGGAITKSPDPFEATKEIIRRIAETVNR